MTSLNWFDFALLLLLAASVITGFRAGLSRVVVHLIATLTGLLAAFWCYRIPATELLPYLNQNRLLADFFGFLIVFLAVMLLGALIAAVLARIFQWIGLSWFDHFLGGFAGAVRGILLVSAASLAVIAFTPTPAPAYLDQSRLLPYANAIAGFLIEAAPRGLKDSFEEQLGNIESHWTPLRRKVSRPEEI